MTDDLNQEASPLVAVARRSATPNDVVLGWFERLDRYADVRLHPRARITPGVLLYRLDDRPCFANASYRAAGSAKPPPEHPLTSAGSCSTPRRSALWTRRGVHILKELIGSLQDERITLVVARLKGPMQRTFAEVRLLDPVGERHVHPTGRAAVQAARLTREGV